MPVKIEMFGNKELQQMLADLPDNIQKRCVKGAIKKGVTRLKAAVQQNAPKRSGKMAEHLRVRMFSNKRGFGGFVENGTREELGISAQDPYYYPAVVEYGSQHVAANPFMRFSMESNKAEVLDYMEVDIQAAVEKATAKQASEAAKGAS